MIGKAGIVVAEDPGPVEPGGQRQQHRPRRFGQAVAAELVVKAVAEAVEPLDAGAIDHLGQRGERRLAVVGRQELAELGVPARFFEMEVGDQQRAPRRPPQGTLWIGEEFMTGERKGNHHGAA